MTPNPIKVTPSQARRLERNLKKHTKLGLPVRRARTQTGGTRPKGNKMVTQKMLEAAMVEAVKRGMFPKDAPADQYITAWDDMRAVLEAAQQSGQAGGDRRCPACKALLEETSVYCDNCGTDTPRS